MPASPPPRWPNLHAVQVLLPRHVSPVESKRQKGAAPSMRRPSSLGISPAIPMLPVLLDLCQPSHAVPPRPQSHS